MALDAMTLKFALAKDTLELDCPCTWLSLKACMNSSLCNLRAKAASSSWVVVIPLLVLPLEDDDDGASCCLCSSVSLCILLANAPSSSTWVVVIPRLLELAVPVLLDAPNV